jgi:hypothetical protein
MLLQNIATYQWFYVESQPRTTTSDVIMFVCRKPLITSNNNTLYYACTSLLLVIKRLKIILMHSVVQDLEEQIFIMLSKGCSAVKEQIFSTVTTKDHHNWALSWAWPPVHIFTTYLSIIYFNIVFSSTFMSLQSALFPWGLPTKILYEFVKNNTRTTNQCFCLYVRVWNRHNLEILSEVHQKMEV